MDLQTIQKTLKQSRLGRWLALKAITNTQDMHVLSVMIANADINADSDILIAVAQNDFISDTLVDNLNDKVSQHESLANKIKQIRQLKREIVEENKAKKIWFGKTKPVNKTSDRQNKITELNKFYEDRSTAKRSFFVKTEKKTEGTTSGYIAKKQKDLDGLPFMIKTAYKYPEFVNKEGVKIIRNEIDQNLDTMSLINEYVTAPLYKAILFKRTPLIEAVESDIVDPDQLCLRSKFLQDFQTLGECLTPAHGRIEFMKNVIKPVSGIEKVLAACLALGDPDIHEENIGIMIEDGKKVFAKIDHGRSATRFFTSAEDALTALFGFYYGEHEFYMNLSIDKFKEAIDQIILTFSDDNLERVIDNRLFNLERLGLDIHGVEFLFFANSGRNGPEIKTFDTFAALKANYIEQYKQQMEVMKEVSARLELVSKIKYSSDASKQQEWKDGGWILAIKGDDPLEWFAQNKDSTPGLELLDAPPTPNQSFAAIK